MSARPRRPTGARLLALAGLLCAAVLGGALPAAATDGPRPAAAPTTALPNAVAAAPTLVIGIGGLRWAHVGPGTPALQGLAQRAALGALSVKAGPAITCPADGWLTLGAGARAQAVADPPPTCSAELTVGPDAVGRNADAADGAVLGLLGAELGPRLVTQGTGAALSRPPGLQAAAASRPDVAVVDLGTLREPVLDSGGRPSPQLVALDRDVALLLAVPRRTVLLVGLSEAAADRAPGSQAPGSRAPGSRAPGAAHLHVAMATGPGFARGALVSASTRRAPYVQLVDVAPTVLDRLGATVPGQMDGQPWRSAGPAPSVAQLVDLDRRAQGARQATVPFFVVLVAGLLLALALLRHRPRALRAVALAGMAAPGASYLANLAPWWRAPAPLLALLAVTGVVAAALATAALLLSRTRPGRTRGTDPLRPVGLVAAATALVVALDLATGARLQIDSVAGYSPLVAGRFAGLGNVAFGVFAAAVLLAAAWLGTLSRRRGVRLGVVAVVGVAAVVLDGAPALGSDVGGVLALVPAVVLLAMLLTGTRVSVARLLAAGLAAAAVVLAFALLDLQRPADRRTHLGRFAEQLREGTAGELLTRKASAVFGLLFSSPVTAMLPLVVAAAVFLVLRPPPPLARTLAAVPALRHALAAIALVSVIGFALNDSGAAVPALALLVAVPAVVAVVAGVAAGRAVGEPRAPAEPAPVA